ncbi:MAG: urease accessory protein UreE [Gammaproteobacteria bacterium]|nr:urease accessory protein UreE [Gammaproteobacteria bacterium]MBQ0839636.1 urease accessory protein UreE [Gammaproteobacteria bacterium]
MRKVTSFVEKELPSTSGSSALSELILTYDERKKSRFKAETTSGELLGVILPRGRVLRGGDLLADEAGALVRIVAAPESLSRVSGDDPRSLTRAAYHLGNRHMPLQVGDGWLSYQHDHVLDDMVRGLGLQVAMIDAAFEPEEGAYSAHSQGAAGHGHNSHGH